MIAGSESSSSSSSGAIELREDPKNGSGLGSSSDEEAGAATFFFFFFFTFFFGVATGAVCTPLYSLYIYSSCLSFCVFTAAVAVFMLAFNCFFSNAYKSVVASIWQASGDSAL